MKQELTIPAMKEIFEFHYYLSNRRSKTYLSSAINIVGKSRLLVFQQNIVILNFGCEKSFLCRYFVLSGSVPIDCGCERSHEPHIMTGAQRLARAGARTTTVAYERCLRVWQDAQAC